MSHEKLKALSADTCWGCGKHKKDLIFVVLSNARGEYDIRYDYLCTGCYMLSMGVGSN
jgi:hypothetical protein